MDTKRCRGCGETKPLGEFYAHPMMGDGYLNHCKVCKREDANRRRAVKVLDPAWVQRELERSREKRKRLVASPPPPERRREFSRRSRERYPDKNKARSIFWMALRRGELVRPEACEDCGAVGRIHGHHPDYAKPLEVEWLCPPCHGLRHRKEAA